MTQKACYEQIPKRSKFHRNFVNVSGMLACLSDQPKPFGLERTSFGLENLSKTPFGQAQGTKI